MTPRKRFLPLLLDALFVLAILATSVVSCSAGGV